MKTKSIYGILVAASFLFAANTFAQTTTEVGNPLKTQTRSQLKDGTGDQLKSQTRDQLKDGSCLTDDPTTATTEESTQIQSVAGVASQSTAGEQVQNKFRISLTEEQLALLENQTMTKAEKQAAFMNSLSADQMSMLKTEYKQQGSVNESVGAQTRDQIKQQQRSQTEDCEAIATSSQQVAMQQAQSAIGSGNKGGSRGNK